MQVKIHIVQTLLRSDMCSQGKHFTTIQGIFATYMVLQSLRNQYCTIILRLEFVHISKGFISYRCIYTYISCTNKIKQFLTCSISIISFLPCDQKVTNNFVKANKIYCTKLHHIFPTQMSWQDFTFLLENATSNKYYMGKNGCKEL